MSGTQLEQWIALIERLPEFVDATWLEAEILRVASAVEADTSGGRRQRRRFHPLAELTYQVRRELEGSGRPEFRPSPNLAKLGAFAFSIRALRDRGTAGLDDRLERLIASDFESTRFELEVAALHLVMGYEVHFIHELPDQRTPDLEVAGSIEVECKRKVELSKRDLAMRDLWGLLERRLYDVLPDSGAFRVELSTVAAPTRSDVDWALSWAKRIAANETGQFDSKVEDGRRSLNVVLLQMVAQDGGIRVTEPSGLDPLEEFDVGKTEITAKAIGTDLRPVLAVQLAFRTDDKKDWLEGVRSSLKNARGQLSGTRPGVVFVEVPVAVQASERGQLGTLKEPVHREFRNSTRLSAVAIAFTGWQQDASGNGQAVAEYHVERNPRAKHPLPVGFYDTTG